MAISQITYATKSDISTTSAPASNKVQASDLNEIKTVVNGNANNIGDISQLTTTSTNLVGAINEINGEQETYSTSEELTDKVWIDNSPIYRKTFKSMGNTGSLVQIAHGITGLKVITNYTICATNESGVNYFLGNSQYPVYFEYTDPTYVYVGINVAYQSAPWTIYFTIEYTKS